MIKEIKVIDKEKNIVRITCSDERWYAVPGANSSTGLPEFKYLPSSTWIADYYPKGIGFFKWLASKGWDESQAQKESAGERGTKIHKSIDFLEEMGAFPIDTVIDGDELSADELEAIMAFSSWWNENKPEVLARELVVFGDGYAGTLDRIYRINGQVYIVDFKTSQHIWESMLLQISSYSHARIDYKLLGITDKEWEDRKLAVLQVGYKMNKKRYKFTEIPDKYELFKVARLIWENENSKSEVRQMNFPLVIKLEKQKEQENGKSGELPTSVSAKG